ncbi:TonB-dependent receptor [Asticcacaulis sp. YBE204]|uniref:TonB-dependent receptor n=1 Tax=Asticcacaulis sp. YBE204 TaxID=1282363 RepID=UPI0003C3B4F3|nr:TonB-dependent receptor [Asticcacaulis sp. YBE204]ESQ78275.1 hypothetical protein AEYBE204_13975 [Asticcacaulis sp. YBE204]
MHTKAKRHLFASVAVIGLLYAGCAFAADFNVPAQPARTAIPAFAIQAKIQIIAPVSLLEGVTTRALVGDYDTVTGLNLLLAGTNLEIASNRNGVIALRVKGTKTGGNDVGGTSDSAGSPVTPVSVNDGLTEVIVIGSRASQQSAIERKKRAATASDSIVADDVGSFPDRNLAEALSRIPGMALGRNETGEGEGISLRGNGSDLTNVEMDGMSVNSAGQDLAVSGGDGAGRGADLRELPADLIKSVDVIKGQTADMTEGGLGGSVLIQTRSGLDFKKPYVQLRVAEEMNTLSERWSPNFGIVASRKFFDNRLGVIFNVSKSRRLNDSHQINGAGSANNGGYARTWDFDGSPEKTFVFNPDMVNGDGATTPFTNSTLTPLEVVKRSAAAKTKAECISAFPLLSDAQLAAIPAGTNNGTRASAQAVNINAQITCLNQWNDYSPGLTRDYWVSQYEDRLAWDIRFDYRVNSHLTVYAKYQVANREQDERRRARTRGSLGATSNTLNFTQSLTTNTNIPNGSINRYGEVAGSGYTLYMKDQPVGVSTLDSTLAGSVVNNAFPRYGTVLNVVPGSVTTENHYVTGAQITNASINYDNIANDQDWKNKYILAGGEYKRGPLNIKFQGSHSDSYYQRTDTRFRRNITYGTGTLTMLDHGLWDIKYPEGFNPDNMEQSVPFVALTGTAAQQAAAAKYTSSIDVTFTPRITEGNNDAAKIDVIYRLDKYPFFTSFKTGVSYSKSQSRAWGAGGYTGGNNTFFVPQTSLDSTIRACENQATTTAANACKYGITWGTGKLTHAGTETITRAQLISIFENSNEVNTGAFMNGYEGVQGLKLWNTVDVDKALSMMGLSQYINFDCMKVCMGTDGKMYDQPVSRSSEQNSAAYAMLSFEQDLPWGMQFSGNFGLRMVQRNVQAAGQVALQSIRKNFSDDGNPNNDWNEDTTATGGYNRVTTTRISKAVYVNREERYWLPSYNAALWVIDDKLLIRYSWARSVAPPPIGRLWPVGTCTVDERKEGQFETGIDESEDGEDATDMACDTFGNPSLKSYKANKNNYSIEWYPNRDTSISLAYYRQKVKIGRPEAINVTDSPVFAGSDEVDPATGQPLSDIEFSYRTYVNGPGWTGKGWELAAKTSLTFLPWRLRYTGIDFNISTNEQSGDVGYHDPITGESLGVPGRSKYYNNLTFWYDDGKTNARLAFQQRDKVLRCVTSCGTTIDGISDFPIDNPRTRVAFPYNPGEPTYTQGYLYLDAKISHKISKNVEIYWEGRNLMKKANVIMSGRDEDKYFAASYGGQRFNIGMTYKLQ